MGIAKNAGISEGDAQICEMTGMAGGGVALRAAAMPAIWTSRISTDRPICRCLQRLRRGFRSSPANGSAAVEDRRWRIEGGRAGRRGGRVL
jgi:hypothetical protein